MNFQPGKSTLYILNNKFTDLCKGGTEKDVKCRTREATHAFIPTKAVIPPTLATTNKIQIFDTNMKRVLYCCIAQKHGEFHKKQHKHDKHSSTSAFNIRLFIH